MASPFDPPAPPESAGPVGGPSCVLCDRPLSTYDDCLCFPCEDELDRASAAETARRLCARDTWAPGSENPRGLPRPIYLGRPLPWAEKEDRVTPFGDEIDSDAAWRDDRLDDVYWETEAPPQDRARLGEAWEEGLCVLCGEPLGDEVHFFTNGEDLAQGGLHARCARLTRAHCPGVRTGWQLCCLPRAAWDELTRAEDGPDTHLGASLPDEYEPVPERGRRTEIS
jgi:hypothetical protein